MGHRSDKPDPTLTGTTGVAPSGVVVAQLDRALRRLRSTMVRPEFTSVPIPALGRVVDLSKVLACTVVAEMTESSTEQSDPAPSVTVKDVAAALGLVHSSASRLLVETEADGLISRHSDPTDRRRTTVRLTDEGTAVAVQSARLRSWLLANVLRGWREDEVDSLTALLERFADSLRAEMPAAITQATGVFSDPTGMDSAPGPGQPPSPTDQAR